MRLVYTFRGITCKDAVSMSASASCFGAIQMLQTPACGGYNVLLGTDMHGACYKLALHLIYIITQAVRKSHVILCTQTMVSCHMQLLLAHVISCICQTLHTNSTPCSYRLMLASRRQPMQPLTHCLSAFSNPKRIVYVPLEWQCCSCTCGNSHGIV